MLRRNFQVATGMVGLYRPLRTPHEDETQDEYGAILKAVRAGTVDVPEVLMPNTMGVVYMKSRNYGEREGMRCFLGVEQGRVEFMPL